MGNMRFKVGDRVRIKSLDWYKVQCEDYNYVIIDFMNQCWCGYEMTIVETDGEFYYMKEDDRINYWTDEMIEGLIEEPITLNGKEVLLQLADIELPSGTTDIWECPEGYIFKDENGNVINATKIVLEKKKKEYPKTFDKCCHILQTAFLCDVRLHKGKYYDIFYALAKLIVCRDAYWKIAGEEMGLGRPWKPDYDSGVDKFGIICMDGVVQESNPTTDWERHLNKILDFPTREMRDAFFENFKSDIEICKAFL